MSASYFNALSLMSRPARPWTLSALAALLLAACAANEPKTLVNAPPTANTETSAMPGLGKALQAQMAQQRGDFAAAYRYFMEAASETGDVQMAKNAFFIARNLGLGGDARLAIAFWREHQPDNIEALMLSTIFAEQAGDHEAALQEAVKLTALASDSADNQFNLLARMSQLDGQSSWNLLQDLDDRISHPEAAWLAAAALLSRADPMRSMALTERALERNPQFFRAEALRAELLVNSGDVDGAVQQLQADLKAAPGNRLLQLELGKVLYGQGRFAAAAQAFDELRHSDASDPEARYLYATSLYMSGDFTAALPLLQLSASENYQLAHAAMLCASAAERLRKLEAAESCYRQVPAGTTYAAARRELARLLQRLKRSDEAMAVLEQARQDSKKPEEQSLLAQARVELMLQNGQREAARSYLAGLPEALAKEPLLRLLDVRLQHDKQPSRQKQAMLDLAKAAETEVARRQWVLTGVGLLNAQKADAAAFELVDALLQEQQDDIVLRYNRALLAETLGKSQLAETDLREVIATEPNHLDAINALGYTLADHNQKLDEAYDLIMRAYQQRPTSAAVIDSLGWLYFRRGELKTAQAHLAQAYALDPEPEIAAHYGEVLWRLGDKKKARQIWAEALEKDPGNRVVLQRTGRYK